jgi:hypothetical protein
MVGDSRQRGGYDGHVECREEDRYVAEAHSVRKLVDGIGSLDIRMRRSSEERFAVRSSWHSRPFKKVYTISVGFTGICGP